MSPNAVPAPTRERMAHWRCGSGTLRMNVALSRLPDFTALPGEGDHLTAGIIMAPDPIIWIVRAPGDVRQGAVEGTHRGDADSLDTLAPAGQHVASLFCQQYSRNCRAGATGTTIAMKWPT